MQSQVVTERQRPPAIAAQIYRDQAITETRSSVPATSSNPVEASRRATPVVQTAYKESDSTTPVAFRSPVVVHVPAPLATIAPVLAEIKPSAAEVHKTKVATALVIVPAEPIKSQVELRMSLAPVVPLQTTPQKSTNEIENNLVAADHREEIPAGEKSILVRRETAIAAPPALQNNNTRESKAVVHAAPEVTSMIAVEPQPTTAPFPRLKLTAETPLPGVNIAAAAAQDAAVPIREVPTTTITPAPRVETLTSPLPVVAGNNRQPAPARVAVAAPPMLATESPQRPSVSIAVPPREPTVHVEKALTQSREAPRSQVATVTPRAGAAVTPRVDAEVTPLPRVVRTIRLEAATSPHANPAPAPVSPLIVAAPPLRKVAVIPAPEMAAGPAKPLAVEPKVDPAPAPPIQFAAAQPPQRQIDADSGSAAPPVAYQSTPESTQTSPPPVAQRTVSSERETYVSKAAPATPGSAVDMLPAVPARPQNSALVSVSQRVHQQVRYAFSLAGRGATHSARVELTDALKLVAMAQDADEGTTRHNEAMMAGLNAMREADDFAVRDSQTDLRIDVERLVATHKTPVLKNAVGPATSPIQALQAYYGYARQQLVIAGGHEIGASMALYGMARIQMAIGGQQGMNGPKAITLHQAALAVDANNYLAANELGVLLARYGQLNEAEASLRHSVAVSPQPETWRNLAEVHHRQGQVRLEAEARRRGDEQLAARRSGRAPNPTASGIVDWVDPATFVAMTDSAPGGVPVSEIAAAAAVATPPNPAAAAVSASQSKSWSLPESIRGLTSRIGQNPKR